MDDFPPIPGYQVKNFEVRRFHVPQKLKICKGYRVVQDEFPNESTSEIPVLEPSLIYGPERDKMCPLFLPRFAALTRKHLTFETVFRSRGEQEKHRAILQYFLEDDTMLVSDLKSRVKLVRRGRILKKSSEMFYHWKDLNVGMDIEIYGNTYHTIDCDIFTREFLTSQGIQVEQKEEFLEETETHTKRKFSCPGRRKIEKRIPSEFKGAVLYFDAVWNQNLYCISYHLSDGTIAIRDCGKNEGKDFSSNLLLRRTKIPKNIQICTDVNFGNVDEIEYISPMDFSVGKEIIMFGRNFMLLNCDHLTRKFYADVLEIPQQQNVVLESPENSCPKKEFKVPPGIPFGTPEDTLASCMSVVPKPPRKDVIRQIQNFPCKLRYVMEMDAVHPEDRNRQFILEYNLGEGTILVNEIDTPNSGRRAGVFLSAMRVPKPGTDPDEPKYYTPEDFFIGAKINIFQHHFILKDAEFFVWKYIEKFPDKFDEELRNNLRQYFLKRGAFGDEEEKRCQTLTDKNSTCGDIEGQNEMNS